LAGSALPVPSGVVLGLFEVDSWNGERVQLAP
jgi:hypothetical protein